MRRQRTMWLLVVRLLLAVTAIASAVVVGGAVAIWKVERGQPGTTFTSLIDGFWWSVSTLTTVGYGDHVPVTGLGRLIGAAVMVAGIAVIGGVAAIVSLAVALRVGAYEEERIEGDVETFERRLERRLAGLEEQLRALDARLDTVRGPAQPDPKSVNSPERPSE